MTAPKCEKCGCPVHKDYPNVADGRPTTVEDVAEVAHTASRCRDALVVQLAAERARVNAMRAVVDAARDVRNMVLADDPGDPGIGQLVDQEALNPLLDRLDRALAALRTP